jgi:hypothetical protein
MSGHTYAHYSDMPTTLEIRTRESSQEDGLDSTYHQQEPANNCCFLCIKTNCLESCLLLEFVMSATILEQLMKVPTAITHSILNMQRYMTQDNNDKILLSFSHSEHFCCCSRDVTMLIHCAAVILGGQRGSVSPSA